MASDRKLHKTRFVVQNASALPLTVAVLGNGGAVWLIVVIIALVLLRLADALPNAKKLFKALGELCKPVSKPDLSHPPTRERFRSEIRDRVFEILPDTHRAVKHVCFWVSVSLLVCIAHAMTSSDPLKDTLAKVLIEMGLGTMITYAVGRTLGGLLDGLALFWRARRADQAAYLKEVTLEYYQVSGHFPLVAKLAGLNPF